MISENLDRNLQHCASAAWRPLIVATVSVLGVLGPRCPGGDGDSISVDPRAEATLLASVGDGFSISRSEHFVLASDLDASRLTELGLLDRLESNYRRVSRFCKRYRLAVVAVRERMELVCFARADEYEKLARTTSPPAVGADGFYDYETKRSYFTNRRDDFGRVTARVSMIDRAWWIVVQHESAHQILDHLAPTLARVAPDWLSEGLACVFETTPDPGEPEHDINRWRLLDVTGADGVEKPIRFTGVVREDWSLTALGPAKRAERYARAWTLVAYLRDERGEAFGRYLRHLATTAEGEGLVKRSGEFEKFFGPADGRMDANIAAYAADLAKRINTADEGGR